MPRAARYAAAADGTISLRTLRHELSRCSAFNTIRSSALFLFAFDSAPPDVTNTSWFSALAALAPELAPVCE